MDKSDPRRAGSSASMAFKVVQRGDLDVCLWINTVSNPAKWEWDEPFVQMQALVAKRPDQIPQIVSIVMTDGGAPGATERNRMFKEIFKGQARLSVVTIALGNPIKRGIATAISWLNPGFRAFEPKNINEAMGHLGLPKDFRVLEREFADLERMLPANETLRLARIAAGIVSPVLDSEAG
jgi:hypothetical protein